MQLKIIDELKRADPKRREKILMRMREKNIAYLKNWIPQLAEYLQATGTGRFQVRINQTFVEVFDSAAKDFCHPPGQLLPYMEQLGNRYHTGWIEKNDLVPLYRGGSEHGILLGRFVKSLHEAVPTLPGRIASGEVRLPPMKDGRCFSGPVVFLGVFTGFHIMYYLRRNEAQNIFLIEPDLDRFAVSCFFLDYEAIHAHYGHLLLHVGADMPQDPVSLLIGSAPITAAPWIRFLPAYPEGKFDEVIAQVGMRWAVSKEIFVPFDREVRNMAYAMRNLRDHRLLMGKAPKLSSKSVIAIVASGPSLQKDLDWLIANQDKVIVFSATSTVRVLKQHGIRIDFQFALDTEIDLTLLDQLQLDPRIPLVAYFKMDPAVAAGFDKVLYVVEKNKANPARMNFTLRNTHPTTGNLVASLAVWAAPERIVMLGYDLSYRDAAASHVKGTMYDDEEGAGHVSETFGRETYPVAPNFSESEGPILAHAYFNNARLSLTELFTRIGEGRPEVLNLSDGALIGGAKPMRSGDLCLQDYPERELDVERIIASFPKDQEGIWEDYELTGEERLTQLRQTVRDAVTLEEFEWTAWVAALDATIPKCWQYAASDGDIRSEIYLKLVTDILTEWYRAALLAHDPAESAELYRCGLEALQECLDALAWPVVKDCMIDAKC